MALGERDVDKIAYVVTIAGKLYGYGVGSYAAMASFRRQIRGASAMARHSMASRCELSPIDDDHASEVAEMLATDIIEWERS
jgi:hypothetical protein